MVAKVARQLAIRFLRAAPMNLARITMLNGNKLLTNYESIGPAFFTRFILQHLDAYRPNRIGRTAFDAKGRYHFERSSLRKIAGFCDLLELFEKRIADVCSIAFGLMMDDRCDNFILR